MREVTEDVLRWRAEAKPVAVATVARVHGSGLQPLAPRWRAPTPPRSPDR